MLEIINGTKKYATKVIFENLNLKFLPGKIYGLVGENGSGKTVIMKCLCGYTSLTSGGVYQIYRECRNYYRESKVYGRFYTYGKS